MESPQVPGHGGVYWGHGQSHESTQVLPPATTSAFVANLPHLPFEIFGEIGLLISRSDLRNLRLVSKTCEAKVSGHYFLEVVVPVRSRQFGPSAAFQPVYQDMLSLGGGRVVEKFGHHVLRFALSLDVDEDALATPRPKIRQEVKRSFWGLYRWPRSTYSRFEDILDIEDKADRHEKMKATLRCLTNVTCLGLCSDVGLGFLCGPDLQAKRQTIRQPIFIGQRNSRVTKWLDPNPSVVITAAEASLRSPKIDWGRYPIPINWEKVVLKAMLKNAGFQEEQMETAISALLNAEGKMSMSEMDFGESHGTPCSRQELIEIGRDHVRQLYYRRPNISPELARKIYTLQNFSLLPNAFTRPQIEMLFELEMTCRAWTESYILSAMDCSGEGCFQNLTTFNIAKIPSSHLHILSRHDFWNAFPSLESVSLGVVADWRRLESIVPGWPSECAVSPIEAVPLAHELINSFIGTCPRIESFHFEWICGGELASGCHQRGRYVLPAPFFAEPEDMSRRTMDRVGQDPKLLRLPYVKHLSLKNCWVAPHVLLQALRGYALKSLESVEFEGVSLSALPVLPGSDLMVKLWNLGTRSDPTTAPSPELPPWMSWAGLIEQVSPSVKVHNSLSEEMDVIEKAKLDRDIVRALEVLRPIIPDASELPKEETMYKLNSLTFKSCGYVDLDHLNFCIEQIPGIDVQFVAKLNNSYCSHSYAMQFMQCQVDPLLGRILSCEIPGDRRAFDVFKFQAGWENKYHKDVIQAAISDDCPAVGMARFSGALVRWKH